MTSDNLIFILTSENNSLLESPTSYTTFVNDDDLLPTIKEVNEDIESSNHDNFSFNIDNNQPGLKMIIKKDTKMKNVTADDKIICHICKKTFKSIHSLNRHKKEHVYEKPYKCLKCNNSYNVMENLLLHQSIHNQNQNIIPKCSICNMVFKRYASLQGHLQTHFKSEFISCKYCDEMFLTEGLREKHISLEHSNECEFEKSKAIVKVKTNSVKQKSKKKHHKCDQCSKFFNKPSELLRHIRIHTGDKPYKCDKCNAVFTQKSSLDIHLLKHSGVKPHKCSRCSLCFSQRGNLKIHMARIHLKSNINGTKYLCSQCPCSFSKLGALNGHITKIHNKLVPDIDNPEQYHNLIKSQLLQLQLPGQSEFNNQELNNHLPTTTTTITQKSNDGIEDNLPESKFPNSYIKLGDRLENGVVVYRRVKQRFISNIRYLLCTYCSKQFRRPSDLLRHIKVHTKEKPYECPTCKRRFAIKSALKNHMRIHERKKNNGYECSYCLQIYDTLEYFEEHILTHKPDYLFKCIICEIIFNTSNELRIHLKEHTKINKIKMKMKNNISTANFDDKIDFDIKLAEPMLITDNGQIVQTTNQKDNILVSPTPSRPYFCKLCEVSFKKSCHLKQHFTKHLGLRPFKCNICNKTFSTSNSLNVHQNIHIGEKKFKCDICSTAFFTQQSLKRHSLSHSDIRNHLCPYCNKAFKNAVNCRKHIKIHKAEIITQLQSKIILIDDVTTNINNSPNVEIQETNYHQEETLPTMQQYYFLSNNNINNINNNECNLINQEIIDSEILFDDTIQSLQHDNNNIDNELINQFNLNNNLILQQNQLNLNDANLIDEDTSMINDNNNVIVDVADTTNEICDETTPLNIRYVNFLVLGNNNNNENLNETNEILEPKDHILFDNGNLMSAEAIMSELENQRDVIENTILNYGDHDDDNNLITDNQIQSDTTQKINILLSTNSANVVRLEDFIQMQPTTLLDHNNRHVVNDLCDDGEVQQIVNNSNEQCDKNNINDNDNNISYWVLKTDTIQHEKNEINETDDNNELNNINREKIINNNKSNKNDDGIDKDDCSIVSAKLCNYCLKEFKKPIDLRRHIRTHTGEKPFKCETCNKCFSLEATLKAHSRLHLTVKEKFPCHVCGKNFACKSSRNVHMRIHKQLKPYKCGYCHLNFRTTGNRKYHEDAHINLAKTKGCHPKDVLLRNYNITKFNEFDFEID